MNLGHRRILLRREPYSIELPEPERIDRGRGFERGYKGQAIYKKSLEEDRNRD